MENEELKQSSIKQFGYLFTSWIKLFESIKIKQYLLLPIVAIIVLAIMSTFFLEVAMEEVLVKQRETLEELYSRDAFSNIDKEVTIENALNGVRNQFKLVPFTLSTSIMTIVGAFIISLVLLIYKFILKGNCKFYSIFVSILYFNVLKSIYTLVYYIITSLTGSAIDIFSLGVFIGDNTSLSLTTLLSSINTIFVLSIYYYYLLGKNLMELSNKKSYIIASIPFITIFSTFLFGVVVENIFGII